MSTSKCPKAEITNVIIIPGMPLQGLMLKDGKFCVAITQIADRFALNLNQATRDLTTLMGKGFQLNHFKVKTALHPKAVNAVSLHTYSKIVTALDRKGNQKARDEKDLIDSLGYTQRFCDAFGIKFDLEERELHLEVRYAGIVRRRAETDAIAEYMEAHPELSDNAKRFMYSNVTDALYKLLFGYRARDMVAMSPEPVRNVTGSLRDCFSEDALKAVEKIEDQMARLIRKKDMHPKEAVGVAFETLLLDPMKPF